MFKKISKSLIIMIYLMILINSVELMIKPNMPTCTVLISSFQPIKVEASFPQMTLVQGQKFRIKLVNQKTYAIVHETYSQPNKIYRNNYHLDSNVVYQLCFQFLTNRQTHSPILVGFKAQQHFLYQKQQINPQIPTQLMNQTNLQIIYSTAHQIRQQIQVTIQHQKKQRQLQDKLNDLSLHKTQRIITITTIQCGIIIISAAYQIFALNKILKDRNIY